MHDRAKRAWQHLHFFQYKAFVHAPLPRVKCGHCGKVTQVEVLGIGQVGHRHCRRTHSPRHTQKPSRAAIFLHRERDRIALVARQALHKGTLAVDFSLL